MASLRPGLRDKLADLGRVIDASEATSGRAEVDFVQPRSDLALKLLESAEARQRRGLARAERDFELYLGDVEELAEAGLLTLKFNERSKQVAGTIRLTATGRRDLAAQAGAGARAAVGPESQTGGLDWERDVLPVLVTLYQLQIRQPPGSYGVMTGDVNAELGRPPQDPQTDRVLVELHSADPPYLREWLDDDASIGPRSCLLAERGLQQVANWPGAGGDNAGLEQFVAVIDRFLADEAVPEEERSKLRRLRESVTSLSLSVGGPLLSAWLREQTGGEAF